MGGVAEAPLHRKRRVAQAVLGEEWHGEDGVGLSVHEHAPPLIVPLD